jgi:ribosomal protein S18 acetylase RimI-like enzyme
MNFELRPATGDDFEFCWPLYRDLMMPLTMELLEWNESGQRRAVENSMPTPGTSIIMVEGSDAGWLQVLETPEEIYLGQLYITHRLQNRGIGSVITRQLCDRARKEGKVLTLEVMKNNRARALYERLGLQVVSSSKFKFKMQLVKSL